MSTRPPTESFRARCGFQCRKKASCCGSVDLEKWESQVCRESQIRPLHLLSIEASLEMAPARSSGNSALEVPTTTTTTLALRALAADRTASKAEQLTGHSEESPTIVPLHEDTDLSAFYLSLLPGSRRCSNRSGEHDR